MMLKSLIFFTIAISTLLSLNNSWAQTELFTGRLIDFETKKPVANAKISVEGGEFSTNSNVLGYFQVRGLYKNIIVTHVGYKTVTTELKVDTPSFLMSLPPARYKLQPLHLKELIQLKGYEEKMVSIQKEIENRLANDPQAELLASFPRGLKVFHDYLINGMYKNTDSLASPIDFTVSFTINKSGELKVDSIQGEIQSTKIIRSIFENSPNWVPALQNGLAVSTSYQQQLSYQSVKEQQAEPKGGIQAFYNYIGRELTDKYPRQAQRMGIEGIVYIQLIVEKDGSLTNVVVAEGIGGGCDEVALEVVKNSPKWSPGKQDGKDVRSQRVIPIRFTLN